MSWVNCRLAKNGYVWEILRKNTASKIWDWMRRCNLMYLKQQYVNIIIIVIRPLGRFGQRPEFSQATGMALVRCILGKFLGVACHCFPPLFRRSHF